MKTFSAAELGENNGENGKPVYVAYKGEVYDVTSSKLWKSGRHMQKHAAGSDLTDHLGSAPHTDSVFAEFEQVGTLDECGPEGTACVPSWAQLILSHHPHPILIHVPQAFFAFAPIFLLLFYYSGNPHFERTAYYLVVTGAALNVPAVLSGFFHWTYKYAKSTKPLFLFKIIAPLALLILSVVTAYLHLVRGPLTAAPIDWLLAGLYACLLPLIVSIGHAGGKIVFGSR